MLPLKVDLASSSHELVRVMLVADRPASLRSLEGILSLDDVALITASSPQEALHLLKEHEIAVAVLDVEEQGTGSFEIAERMRADDGLGRVPIIFITHGDADNFRRFRGYEAGAVDYIQKPVVADALRVKTEVFCDLHRQRCQIEAQRAELAATAKALHEADARKDRFLAVLAHELRNPVAALMSGLDLLGRPRGIERADEIRAQMSRLLFHLSRMVEDLLDVARVSEGKLSLRLERMDLRLILTSAVEGSQHNIQAAGHTLVVDFPAEPIMIEADHTRLAQVVANLLNNAAKYTPSGGKITLSTQVTGRDVEIRVSDNGVGIPEAMLPHIFGMFIQVDGHQARAQGGLGIGLALVRQLVALHGGTIRVESEGEGKGSTFIVTLALSRVV